MAKKKKHGSSKKKATKSPQPPASAAYASQSATLPEQVSVVKPAEPKESIEPAETPNIPTSPKIVDSEEQKDSSNDQVKPIRRDAYILDIAEHREKYHHIHDLTSMTTMSDVTEHMKSLEKAAKGLALTLGQEHKPELVFKCLRGVFDRLVMSAYREADKNWNTGPANTKVEDKDLTDFDLYLNINGLSNQASNVNSGPLTRKIIQEFVKAYDPRKVELAFQVSMLARQKKNIAGHYFSDRSKMMYLQENAGEVVLNTFASCDMAKSWKIILVGSDQTAVSKIYEEIIQNCEPCGSEPFTDPAAEVKGFQGNTNQCSREIRLRTRGGNIFVTEPVIAKPELLLNPEYAESVYGNCLGVLLIYKPEQPASREMLQYFYRQAQIYSRNDSLPASVLLSFQHESHDGKTAPLETSTNEMTDKSASGTDTPASKSPATDDEDRKLKKLFEHISRELKDTYTVVDLLNTQNPGSVLTENQDMAKSDAARTKRDAVSVGACIYPGVAGTVIQNVLTQLVEEACKQPRYRSRMACKLAQGCMGIFEPMDEFLKQRADDSLCEFADKDERSASSIRQMFPHLVSGYPELKSLIDADGRIKVSMDQDSEKDVKEKVARDPTEKDDDELGSEDSESEELPQ